MIPRKVHLYAALGKIIFVREAMSPSDPRFEQAVEEFHKRVMNGMLELYDRHKGRYGWEDRPLVLA